MIDDFVRALSASIVAIDTETTGLYAPRDRAFGVSVASEAGRAYVDLREHAEAARAALRAARPRTWVAHNAQFDVRMLAAAGIFLDPGRFDDTVIRAALLNEHEASYSLDALSQKYLGAKKESEIYGRLADLFGGAPTRGVQMPRIADAPSSLVAPYAITDAVLTLRLWEWQEPKIDEAGLRRVVEFEQRRLFPVLLDMSTSGIRVDVDRAGAAMDAITPVVAENQAALDKAAGFEVNVNAPDDIARLFDPQPEGDHFVSKHGDWIPATDGGAPSFSAGVLRSMNSAAAKLVLETRSLLKTRDTFLAKHVIEHAVGGRVFPSINQTRSDSGGGTGTGRFSYTDPALQQIPSRNRRVAEVVKSVFLPEEGQVWCDGDLASFEVRVFAHWAASFDGSIAAAYKSNPELDFHQYVADLTNLVRNAEYSGQANAKQLNLSMIFNSGNGAIAEKMGMPFTWAQFSRRDGTIVKYRKAGPEAAAVIAKYHAKMPGVKQFAEDAKAVVEARARTSGGGYLRTYRGRMLRFPDVSKAYKASGIVIQATAAELNKAYVIAMHEEAKKLGGRLLINTHDSYSVSLPREDVRGSAARLKASVEQHEESLALRVPIILEMNEPGENWFDSWCAGRLV